MLGLMESVCLVELNQGGSTVLYCPEQESIRLPGVATLIVFSLHNMLHSKLKTSGQDEYKTVNNGFSGNRSSKCK